VALSLVLLAGASRLAGQTGQNPVLVVFGTGANDSLQFAHQISTTAPPAQVVRVYSAPNNIPFTATAQTTSGGGWLFVNNGLTAVGGTGTGNAQDLTISVAPQGLATGAYQGTVTITSGQTSVAVKVSLSVSTLPQLRLDPASLPATPVEANQITNIPLTVSSTGSAVQYIAQVVSAEPNTGWLVPPGSGNTGTKTQVIVNAAQIPPDRTLAVGALRFTPLNGGGPVTFPISVTITPGAQIQVAPTSVNLPFQIGFAPPTARPVTVSSTTQTQLAYTATITSASPWLTLAASPSGPGSTSVTGLTTPAPFYLIPNIAAVSPLVPGTLDATIRIDSPTATSQTVTAHLIISNQPQFTLTQDSATFNYTFSGTAPSAVPISLGSTSTALAFTAAPNYVNANNFFTVTPTTGSTPQNLIIAADPTKLSALAAGTYTGSVHVTSSGTNSVIDIPVTLNISGSTLLTVDNPAPDPFEAALGQTPAARSIIVRSTDNSNQPFSVGVEYGPGASNWLILSNTSGTTGTPTATITMNVNPQAVTAPGNYTSTLVITPTGVQNALPLRVPIRYNVTGSSQVTANPAKFDLTQQGTTAIATQTVALTSATTGLSWVASADQPWIRLVNTTGTIPGQVQFNIDAASITPRTDPYTGNIIISVSGVQTLTVPVSVRTQSGGALQATPTTLTVSYAQGGSAPATQTINLSSNGPAVPFTAAATTATGGNWLSVSPASGTTGASGAAATPLTVTVNPQGVAVGTYQGTITVTPTGTGQSAITVAVTLTVAAQSAPSGLTVGNAATGLSRAVAPGEIITIRGRNMAPSQGQSFTVTNGTLPFTLGNVSVTFDGIAAALLYAGPSGDKQGDQINAIVPYGIGGRSATRLVVTYQNVASDALALSVAETDPGIFTANQSGSGGASVLNQDNSVNSASNPAAAGTIVQIFGTGEGLITPALGEGKVVPTTAPFPQPLSPVTVRLNNQPVEVLYAGSAPGLVAGVIQINVRIPSNLNISAVSNLPVQVQVGQAVSQPNVTISIRP